MGGEGACQGAAIENLIALQLFERRGQLRDGFLYRLPDNAETDPKVGMDETIAHSYELTPRNLGMRVSE